MKNAAITTTLLSSLLVACGDGVTVGDSALQSDGNTPVADLQTPFTPVANDIPANNVPNNDTQTNEIPANNAPNNDTQTNDTQTNDTQTNDIPANNAPNNGTGNVNFYGLLSISENVTDNQVTAFSAFMQFPNSMPIAQLTAELAPTQDVCTITNDSQTIDDADLEATFVSAGEVLTVTSANGTYMELMREEIQGGFIAYNPQPDFVAGRLPTNLVIDIPGDVFPAFANVAAAAVQTLNVTAPNAEEPITPTTAFSWNAGNTAGNIINISATSFINAEVVTVTCTTADDGEFTFPAATQIEMGNEFTSIFSSISRDAFVAQQNGDAAILVTSSSKAR